MMIDRRKIFKARSAGMEFIFTSNTKTVFSLLGGYCLLAVSCSNGMEKSEENKLNVVFLLADDLQWNSLGCAGNNTLQTKNIDGLARDSIRFSNACVTTSISMVSRANLLTGQYMSRHGIRDFGVELTDEAFLRTYPAILRKSGYWTGYVGKYGVGRLRQDDFDFSVEYEGSHWVKEKNGDSVHVTLKNSKDAVQFLREPPKDKPFLLTIGFFAAHAQDNPSKKGWSPVSMNGENPWGPDAKPWQPNDFDWSKPIKEGPVTRGFDNYYGTGTIESSS
jgi:arylsulfatase A-like enzyme